MYFATIDCGTTNSRVYIVNEKSEILGQAEKKVGVKDTAITGNNHVLKSGLVEIFNQALDKSHLSLNDVKFIISSGMITSEIGLIEIPHIWAPANSRQLANHIKKIQNPSIFPIAIPIYFVCGIKNKYDLQTSTIKDVGNLDFMRGEETQVVGLFSLHNIKPPFTVVVLSSHTKFIPVDIQKNILGSITTVSGQVYEAIIKETSVGKSIKGNNDFDLKNYFNEEIVNTAFYWVKKSGFLRSLLLPRFMDVLLKTKWYERKLFVEAVIASEDLETMNQLPDCASNETFILIGVEQRVLIYQYLLKEKKNIKNIFKITNKQDIHHLSISGSVHLAKLAGLIA
ncbi:MAG TPA: 2-dehydro-3-deoxygalactonokinase [Atribacterota bacterium]|nr:2-dehydro-3-deoxygalactonokinase [Atribacterota bacterium]HOR43021.1 2-dehydro-3-deoxygalactonokinase [Atribacterota bacterium]